MRQIFYVCIVVILFSACSTRKYKEVTYFNDLNDSSTIVQQIENYQALRIQKDDILALNISSLNDEASAIFNRGNIGTSQNSASSTITNGFTVDANGAIQLPKIGSIQVAGLTTTEARELIQKKLLNDLKEPVVSLRIANFKVSIIGDVAKPGVYPINSERVSVIDALGFAGDLNITALRKNILLVREVNGERKFIRLDMNSKELFKSPYFYLQNNDALYVQPGDAKYANVDTRYRNVSLGLSIISIIVLVITRL
ncbi:polysaccharide biosynthesis/export family protein [Pedobacter boryungensis]|uniref:Polysaccharide biosynthesis/export family protein n=1 Tax=Pedobacter boryungensis TaxID=869962 RepID=A0ABX2DIJ6_9SPHI|nr:polysaccharide biosynthesis/export family protein [Pedobacter boryungensis]NQX32741.1 polysaccharide biosynthesis/export family protein [Pedobacter boryungensis]